MPLPPRRLLAWLLACVAIACSQNVAAAPPVIAEFALENPAPGVYVHYGQQAEMTSANYGDVANLGFIVGTRCVAVIDTGGTFAVGSALRRAIQRIATVPICFVINTHVHPDHIFGNAAFADDHPEFIGHVRLTDAMRTRGANYLNALKRDLGDVAEGSAVVLPTRSVAVSEQIDLGGRVLTLRAWPTAHTDTDLTVFDNPSKTLWLGDLVFVGHVPVLDGNLRGYLAALDVLNTTQAELAIPGHGRALAWPEALAPERRYLNGLMAEVLAAIKAKRTLTETLASVDDRPGNWLLFDQFHRRNVTAAYSELEWDE